MTLEDMIRSDKPFVTPQDVADVLQCSAQIIRIQARDNPEALGFPVIRVGNRTKIPRKAFVQFMGERDVEP